MITKKRVTLITLVVLMVLTSSFNVLEARSAERNIKVWIHDFYVMSDVNPFVAEGRTFVPVRFIAEELGYNVDWHGKIQTVSIEESDTKVLLKIGSNEVNVNGQINYLDAAARIKEERTFIPLRAVAELFGKVVNYDSEYKIVSIGDEFNAKTCYPVKYYLGNNEPVITDFKVDFATCTVQYSNDQTVNLEAEQKLFEFIDQKCQEAPQEEYQEEYQENKDEEFKSQVEKEKQLYDQYYIEPVTSDALVGSWYGTVIDKKTPKTYYDSYMYIEKIGHDKYLVVERVIKPNGSQLVAESYGTYDAENKLFTKERSHKTTNATGDFNRNWTIGGGERKVDNFDYMYTVEDPNSFARKY